MLLLKRGPDIKGRPDSNMKQPLIRSLLIAGKLSILDQGFIDSADAVFHLR